MKRKVDPRIIQFIRFCLVGSINTLLTLSTIFVCKSLLGVNDYISNIIGYIIGVVNSFFWNKQWVFHSHGRYHSEALRFATGFLFSYGLQLATVELLNTSAFGSILINLGFFTLSGYGIATLIGCVVYTVSNFLFNRLITFHHHE